MTFDFQDMPKTFRVGDTYGSIGLRIASGLFAEIFDPSTTATFSLRDPLGEGVVVFEQPARIVDVVEHAASGTWGGGALRRPGGRPRSRWKHLWRDSALLQ